MAVVDDIGEDVLAARMLQAAASGDLEHLKYLVQGGADPATLKDYDKRTALHLAVAEGRQLVSGERTFFDIFFLKIFIFVIFLCFNYCFF